MKPPAANEFDSPEPAIAPGCAQSHAALQNRLDGDPQPFSEPVRQHLNQCAECKAYADAAQSLLAALPALKRETPPSGFADRVLAAASAQPFRPWYKRRLIWTGGFALAASVLIAVLVVRESATTIGVREVVVKGPPPVKEELPPALASEKPVPLRDSLQEAGSAVGILTRRATEDGFGLSLPKWPMPKAKVDPAGKVDPGLVSWQEVRHNAAMSIAPITDSAKRAFGVFWREFEPNMGAKSN